MEYQSADDAGQVGGVEPGSTSFIGSFLDDPEDGLIVLRGDLGAAAVDRLGCHIDTFLAGPTRFLMLDARAVDSYHGDLLSLLARTQRRLATRRGMLQLRGLDPARVTEPAGPGHGRHRCPDAPTSAVSGVESGTAAAAVS